MSKVSPIDKIRTAIHEMEGNDSRIILNEIDINGNEKPYSASQIASFIACLSCHGFFGVIIFKKDVQCSHSNNKDYMDIHLTFKENSKKCIKFYVDTNSKKEVIERYNKWYNVMEKKGFMKKKY